MRSRAHRYSSERRKRCEAIARRAIPDADEINVLFADADAQPLAEVWRTKANGVRSAQVFAVREDE